MIHMLPIREKVQSVRIASRDYSKKPQKKLLFGFGLVGADLHV